MEERHNLTYQLNSWWGMKLLAFRVLLFYMSNEKSENLLKEDRDIPSFSSKHLKSLKSISAPIPL